MSFSSRQILPGLICLVLAAICIAAAFSLDQPVRQAIQEAQGKGWKKTAEYQVQASISKYGDWPQLMLIGGIGLLAAWKTKRRDWMRIIAAAMIASTLAGILCNASRLTTGRTRPRESPKIEQGWYGLRHEGQWLIGNSKYNSFPSGHTATAFGFAGVFLFARPLFGIFMMLGAIAIAWSRMALGAHHLSDITVATLLAMAVAWFTWRWVSRHGDQAFERILSKVRRRFAKAH